MFCEVGFIPACTREQWTEVSSEGIQSHMNTDGDHSCHWKPVFKLSAMCPQTALLVITVLDRVSYAKAPFSAWLAHSIIYSISKVILEIHV